MGRGFSVSPGSGGLHSFLFGVRARGCGFHGFSVWVRAWVEVFGYGCVFVISDAGVGGFGFCHKAPSWVVIVCRCQV